MSDQDLKDSWWLLSRARGIGLVLRVLILAAPLMALGATSAAGQTIPAINVAITAAALACVLAPDSHVGLVAVGLIGIQWLVAVQDPTTPWVLAVAVSISVFHAGLAAAIAVPPAARWTHAMIVRWTSRLLVVVAASGGTWVASRLVASFLVAGNAMLLTASLVVLAMGGLWARDGALATRRSRSDLQ